MKLYSSRKYLFSRGNKNMNNLRDFDEREKEIRDAKCI